MYQLENLNIDQKVAEAVDEQVSEAVRLAMVGPLRSRFNDLSTLDMKELLQNRMFVENQYTVHEAHSRLYEALETSIQQENAEILQKEMDAERKKKRKQQEHPKPPSGHL